MLFESYKIKDVMDINPQNISKTFNSKTINYLDTSNITEGRIDEVIEIDLSDAPSRAKRIVSKNDIVYSTVRPNLKHYGILKKPYPNMIVSTGFVVLRKKDSININPEYVYYYLTLPEVTNYLHLIAENSTSAYPSIKYSDLANLTIKIPNIDEQNKIVKILSLIDEKKESNNKLINTLQRVGLELYEYLFTNFVLPDNYPKQYKSSSAEFEYSESLQKYIPKNWSTKKLNRLFEFERGVEPGAKNYQTIKSSNNIRFTRVGDMLNKLPTIYVSNDLIKNKIINFENVSVSFDGTLGRVACGVEGSYSTGIRKITTKDEYKELFSNGFIYFLANSDYFQETLKKHATGTTILHASNSINYFEIPYNKAVIKEFSQIAEIIYRKILENKKENILLYKIKKTLLPKLIKGEINVDDVRIN